MPIRKIINDPVHGFITLDDPLVLQIIAHPWYQRLRRIHQMAMAHLVYPGAVHTRLHHSLGAYHLMCNALAELKNKGVEITREEEQAAKIAILLHDIGHGPFSHALEHVLIEGMHHEQISVKIMEAMNLEFGGKLEMALAIFNNQYSKKFLHQLISGQLDVDRMDYLSRDSFFSGVSEGVIGYDRIIKMLTVHEGELMVEEKGIYSIEKFIVARRLMYWQVYLHKTVLCAEQMLQQVIRRAKAIRAHTSTALAPLIHQPMESISLEDFCRLDDHDVLCAIKEWCRHEDAALAYLSRGIIDRRLLKVQYFSDPVPASLLEEKRAAARKITGICNGEEDWVVFTGEASSRTYNFEHERIRILFKDGSVRDISEVDNALVSANLGGKIKKHYICYVRD